MPFYDNSQSDPKGNEMVLACRKAIDDLNLWLDTADMQKNRYCAVSDPCLEKLAETAEALQKTLVRL